MAALDAARALFRSQIEGNRGRVVDMAGDSILAVFQTATGAVAASLAIQRDLAACDSALPIAQRMRFRIGVHLGDVFEKTDGSVYGDGVNIAARLQLLAEAGGVSVSEAVRDATRGKVPASFVDRGAQHVKNIRGCDRLPCRRAVMRQVLRALPLNRACRCRKGPLLQCCRSRT